MAANMLDVLRRIILEVNAAPDLNQALNIIVQRVKKAIGVDVASVYLTDYQRQQHVLMATDGFNPDAVGKVRLNFGDGLISVVTERAEPLNLEDGSAHPRYHRIVETGETSYHGFLGVPIIQHKKVLGVLVVRQHAVREFAENEETFLVTLAAQLAGAIAQVAWRVLRGASAEEAIEAPRVHVDGGTVHVEGGWDDASVAGLQAAWDVVRWAGRNLFFGGVQAVELRSDGTLAAAGDPRRGGAGVVFG